MTKTLLHVGGRVLAAIDDSVYTGSVASYAAWSARRLDAPLEFVHVLDRRRGQPGAPDLSGNLALDTREQLLAELVQLDEQRGKLAQEAGRLLLQQVQAAAQASHGVAAETRLRHGSLSGTLGELEPDVRMFVIGKRGEHADFDTGHLGSQLERVVRSVRRPLLVAPRTFREPRRVMVAFDGSATTRKGIEIVAASPLFRGLDVVVLMVGEADAQQASALHWAEETLREHGHQVESRQQSGAVNETISAAIDEERVDVLVMGAYGHSRIRNMIVGSTTTYVLRTSHVPVLLLR
ncbi:universal stress protein [Luteimonas terricola]|nr:universal stress protein [Luteimonas terricola]